MSRKESLVRGAAALAVAGLIIKVTNLLVRVPLTRLIHSEGIGIYQIALPALWALYHLAAGGIPVAVQNLVAEYTAKGRRLVAEQVMRMALSYTLVVGGIASGLLFLCAPGLAKMLGEPRAYWSLVALAPAVVLLAIDSIYRNYLQGRNLMSPSAIGSVFEQGTKILVSVTAAYLLLPRGMEYAAGGAALGITGGAVISVLYMMYVYRQVRSDDDLQFARPESRSLLARRMLRLAWPVTIGSVTLPLFALLDVALVQRGFLRAGYPPPQATALYGAYAGIAVQVVWFPFVLTNALGNALVPVLAAAKAQGDKETVRARVFLGLRTTALVCLPVTMGVAVLARPIAELFGDANAAVPLLYMAPAAFLGPLAWLMVSQLQALGRTGAPMRNLGIGWVVKLVLDALFAPIRGIDVKGVSAASMLLFLIVCILNAREVEKELDEPIPWAWLLRGPLLASMAMGVGLFGLAVAGYLPTAGWTALTSSMVVAPLLYVGVLLATRALTWGELREMSGPVGSRLERWFHAIWPWS